MAGRWEVEVTKVTADSSNGKRQKTPLFPSHKPSVFCDSGSRLRASSNCGARGGTEAEIGSDLLRAHSLLVGKSAADPEFLKFDFWLLSLGSYLVSKPRFTPLKTGMIIIPI